MTFNRSVNPQNVSAGRPPIPGMERLQYGAPRPPGEPVLQPLSSAPAFPLVSPFGTREPDGTAEPQDAIASGNETGSTQAILELEVQLARETAAAQQSIAAAREEGRREGQRMTEAAFDRAHQQNRAAIAAAVDAFAAEQQRYFKNVEMEVVRLSLAIAARVLHREAQMDPLFLAGAVRVALDKLADSSNVVLRVNPAQVLLWQETFRLSGTAGVQPEILGDLSLPAGECVLETRLGTIEVGVRAQLEEIEKGFFDLLDQRPSFASPGVKRAG